MVAKTIELVMAEKMVTIPLCKDLAVYKKKMKRKSHDTSTTRPGKRRKVVGTEENRRMTRSMTKAWSE